LQILAISVYYESNAISGASFERRANVYPGKAPLSDIVHAEVTGVRSKKKPVQDLDWSTQRVVNKSEVQSRGIRLDWFSSQGKMTSRRSIQKGGFTTAFGNRSFAIILQLYNCSLGTVIWLVFASMLR
jgi:hypothetical protein